MYIRSDHKRLQLERSVTLHDTLTGSQHTNKLMLHMKLSARQGQIAARKFPDLLVAQGAPHEASPAPSKGLENKHTGVNTCQESDGRQLRKIVDEYGSYYLYF